MTPAYENITRDELITRLIAAEKSNEQLRAQLQELTFQIKELVRLVHGAKSERYVAQDAAGSPQLSLGLVVEPTAEPVVEVAMEKKTVYVPVAAETPKKAHPGRSPLPSHLTRVEIVIEPTEDVMGLVCIGYEITEELEYKKGQLFVNQFKRAKYALPVANQKTQILIGELPVRPIEKAIAGPELLAYILISKYCDHLPCYRQVQMFARQGVNISPVTINDWITATCDLLQPLYDLLKRQVLSEPYLQVDETPIKVLDKDKKGSTHRGFHWLYHAPLIGMVLFDYQPGRGREGPEHLLKDFKGPLQTDGYGVYEAFDQNEGITQIQCMAHARRMFEKALDNDSQRASYALTEIQKLYAIERKAKDESLNYDQRYDLRQQEALPLLTAFNEWLIENMPKKEKTAAAVLPASTIGKAINYALSRWHQLMIYAHHGELHIDNNAAENAIRPIALGRKNYLFAGSHKGAERAAMIYSLLATYKKQSVEPSHWLAYVLKHMASHPINKLEQLLPNNYIISSSKNKQDN